MILPSNEEAAAFVMNEVACLACEFSECGAAFFVGYLVGHFDTLVCNEEAERIPLQIMNLCFEHQQVLRAFLDRANAGLNAHTDLDEFTADFQAKWAARKR